MKVSEYPSIFIILHKNSMSNLSKAFPNQQRPSDLNFFNCIM